MVPLAPVENLRYRCGITWLTASQVNGIATETRYWVRRIGVAGRILSFKEGFSFTLTHGIGFDLYITQHRLTTPPGGNRLQLDVGYKGYRVGLLGQYAQESWDSDEPR